MPRPVPTGTGPVPRPTPGRGPQRRAKQSVHVCLPPSAEADTGTVSRHCQTPVLSRHPRRRAHSAPPGCLARQGSTHLRDTGRTPLGAGFSPRHTGARERRSEMPKTRHSHHGAPGSPHWASLTLSTHRLACAQAPPHPQRPSGAEPGAGRQPPHPHPKFKYRETSEVTGRSAQTRGTHTARSPSCALAQWGRGRLAAGSPHHGHGPARTPDLGSVNSPSPRTRLGAAWRHPHTQGTQSSAPTCGATKLPRLPRPQPVRTLEIVTELAVRKEGKQDSGPDSSLLHSTSIKHVSPATPEPPPSSQPPWGFSRVL